MAERHILQMLLAICAPDDFKNHWLTLANLPPIMLCASGYTKPIPRWDVHFGEIDDDRKDSTAPHITFRPQLGGHR